MSRSKKPRKAYKPRSQYLNTMRVAQALKSTLTIDERKSIINEAAEALAALRAGQLTINHWRILGECANVGMALSSIGICSDAESRATLEAMLVALKNIAQRFNERGIRSAAGPELVAIDRGLERHIIQLDYCSAEELRDAVLEVEKLKNRARMGLIDCVQIGAPA